MKILHGFVGLGVIICLCSAARGAIYLSLHPFSSSIGPGVTAADVLVGGPTGLSVWRLGSDLGLDRDGDNLNALASGRDPISGPVTFSVDSSSLGLPGSAVDSLVTAEGVSQAAAALFQSLPPQGTNIVFRNAEMLSLIPGDEGVDGDELNALSLLPFVQGVYFSIDGASDSVAAGVLPSNIFLDSINTVFATWENVGLDPDDDLDALWLWDVTNPGSLDPQLDQALFSLAAGSPSLSLLGFSRGDIFHTSFTGSFQRWASAADLGLDPLDDLNALSPLPPPDVSIPEPGSLLIWVSLAAGCLWKKRHAVVYYQT